MDPTVENLEADEDGHLPSNTSQMSDRLPNIHPRRLAAAMEASMEGLAILANDVYVYMNPAHARMYGYDHPDELIGKSWTSIYDASEVERIENEIMPVLQAEGHWRGRTVGRGRDGSRVDGEICLTVTPDGDLVCTCLDISPILRVTDALLTERRWHSTVLEAADAGAWAWDLSANQMHANEEYVAMLGGWNHARPLDVMELTRERLHAQDFAALEQQFWRADRPFGIDARVTWPDGTEHLVRFRGRRMSEDEGAHRTSDVPFALAGVCWDRTGELEIERLRDELISVVCHELRTPLTSLRGFAELMLKQDFPRDKQQRFLEIMLRESIRTSELLNEFLAVQRADSLDGNRRMHPVDVEPSIRDAIESIALLEADQARTRLELAADLVPLTGDPSAVAQVLVNMLSNAYKFSQAPEPVIVSAWRGETEITIEVRDRGMGIPPREQDLVFERFYRASNAEAASIPGTGLGLALVRRLAESMNGRVTLDSRVGIGTTVRVTLPVHQESTRSATGS